MKKNNYRVMLQLCVLLFCFFIGVSSQTQAFSSSKIDAATEEKELLIDDIYIRSAAKKEIIDNNIQIETIARMYYRAIRKNSNKYKAIFVEEEGDITIHINKKTGVITDVYVDEYK